VKTKLGILVFANHMNNAIERAVSYFAGIMFFGVTILALVEIIRRYIFSLTFEWGQDAAIYTMVTAVGLFFCVTQIRRGHLVMAAYIEYLNHRKFYRLVGLSKIAVSAITSIFCISFSIAGWSTLQYSFTKDAMTDSLVFNLWPFHLLFMIGIGLMGLVALFQIIEDVVAYKNGDHLAGDIVLVADI
jgi:TRAP-type C4-dicarboxylate transport system permease small subunit